MYVNTKVHDKTKRRLIIGEKQKDKVVVSGIFGLQCSDALN